MVLCISLRAFAGRGAAATKAKKTAVLGLNTPGIGSRALPQLRRAHYSSETLDSLLCLAALHKQLGRAHQLSSPYLPSLTFGKCSGLSQGKMQNAGTSIRNSERKTQTKKQRPKRKQE
ncbi:hypothetical protein DV515_00015330, partial [Chloebia gouldiae]